MFTPNSGDRDNFTRFALNPLTRALLLALALGTPAFATAQDSVPASADTAAAAGTTPQAAVTEFNTDVMDVEDRGNVDVSHFARAGYVMPGDYPLTLNVNGTEVREVMVTFAAPANDPHGSVPCGTFRPEG